MPLDRHHGSRLVLALAVAAALGGVGTARGAEVVLGIADALSVDQPRVAIAIEDPTTEENLGPNVYNEALLDTGANGLLLAGAAFLESGPYVPAPRTDGTTVTYFESGVAGFEELDVYIPYNLYYAGTDGVPLVINEARLFGRSTVDLANIPGIIGMPAMEGRVVNLDLKPLGGLDFMTTAFDTVRPAATPTSFHVNLARLPYEHAGVDPDYPNDPKPTFADLPLVENVKHTFGGTTASQTLLLDTGAQTSIISSTMAASLGINLDPEDPNNHIVDLDGDGQITEDDYLPVGGIGGTVLMPFTQLSRLSIPTAEGVDLVFTNVEVGVLDIVGVDGVLGMNILTSGYGDLIFGGGEPGEYGYFGNVIFDFTGGQWVMRLDANPDVVPEPATGLLVLLPALLLARRPRRACRAAA